MKPYSDLFSLKSYLYKSNGSSKWTDVLSWAQEDFLSPPYRISSAAWCIAEGGLMGLLSGSEVFCLYET